MIRRAFNYYYNFTHLKVLHICVTWGFSSRASLLNSPAFIFISKSFSPLRLLSGPYWENQLQLISSLPSDSVFFPILKQCPGIYLSFHFPSVSPSDQPEQSSPLFSRVSFLLTRSGLLTEIRWSISISNFQRILCVSFFMRDSGLCMYYLVGWSIFNFFHNWINFSIQSCLVVLLLRLSVAFTYLVMNGFISITSWPTIIIISCRSNSSKFKRNQLLDIDDRKAKSPSRLAATPFHSQQGRLSSGSLSFIYIYIYILYIYIYIYIYINRTLL